MSKTYRRNSWHKPKQHGRVFEKKKDKWVPKKKRPKIDDSVTDIPPEHYDWANYPLIESSSGDPV